MPIVLHIISAIIKSVHLFFGNREAWYLLVLNRNLIIFFIVISMFLFCRFLYGRAKNFANFSFNTEKEKIYIEKFILYCKKLYVFSKFALLFWGLSFLMSGLDTILCYFHIRKTDFIMLTELFPMSIIVISFILYNYKERNKKI